MKVDHLKITEVIVMDKADVVIRSDGAIMANPRVGRIGIQLYQGKELGRDDMEVVRVYRPEDEVMNKLAMASITHRPVTNDHPSEPVTADNWKKYAVGHTGDTVARDGEFIRVPMMLSDGGAIKDYNDGKKELSLGYLSNLEWRSGKTLQGELYDAVQTNIRINHLALVDAARGGPKLAIGDRGVSLCQDAIVMAKKWIADGKIEYKEKLDLPKATSVLVLAADGGGVELYPFTSDGTVYRSALQSIREQAATNQEASVVAAVDELITLIDEHEEKRMPNDTVLRMHLIDGISVEMSDISASVVMRRIKGLEQEAADLHEKLTKSALKQKEAEEKATKAETDAKAKQETDAATIVTLKKQLEDAKITPAALDALVKDRSETAIKGKIILGDKFVSDGKTVTEMRRQVVEAKLGDQAKPWSEDAIAASFATLTSDIKPEQVTSAADAMRFTFNGKPPSVNDASKPYVDYNKRVSDAWKTPVRA